MNTSERTTGIGASHNRIPLELLAPAGGPEQLEYAIRFGADAVYLAVERFGMRRRAGNFTLADLPRTVEYAHERDVAVHLACNVVMHQDDLDDLPAYLEAAQAAGVDALIIEDLGAFRLARRYAPDVALHVSTQASVANSEAALAWYEMGASRIVCAREMSVADIARMHADLPDDLELEVFAHGSMCMAYSGRCMVSDYLTGRGANDGHCTQPCRWAWELHEPSRPGAAFAVEEDADATYLFNSCDLNMLAHLDDLAAAGVDSVKLEGRARGAFYAATVTGAYRRVLDGEDPADVAPELETFSHHPYSTGFFYGPAHQAPASAVSEQTWIWAAEVVSCEAVDDRSEAGGPSAGHRGPWQVEVVARNKFGETSDLEVVSPGMASRHIAIGDLQWLHENEAEAGVSVAEPVCSASRQMDRYLFRCDRQLRPHDIVRMKCPPVVDGDCPA